MILFMIFIGGCVPTSDKNAGLDTPEETDITTETEDTAPTGPTGLEWWPVPERLESIESFGTRLIRLAESDSVFVPNEQWVTDNTVTTTLLGSVLNNNGSVRGEVWGPISYSPQTWGMLVGHNHNGTPAMAFPSYDPAEDWEANSGYVIGAQEAGTLTPDDFHASQSGIGLLNGEIIVPVTADDGSSLTMGTPTVLGGEDVFIGADSFGNIEFYPFGGEIVSPAGGGTMQVLAEDFNDDGETDLMVINYSDVLMGQNNISTIMPRIWWGPLDPANPPTWDQGQIFWPDTNGEENFNAIGVIAPLPLKDRVPCWLEYGTVWSGETGANGALARACATMNHRPEVLVVAPSSVLAQIDATTTVVVGNEIWMALPDGQGPQDPADHYRRQNGIFRWKITD